jgi:regulator of protease activity HflC (stomatin/prohibitin superfamily)
MSDSTVGKIIALGIALVLLLILGYKCVTSVNADEIIVRQGIIDGQLTVWTDPGPKFQNFGTIVTYKKAFQYSFSAAKDQGKDTDQSVKVRFNDGGHGNVSGTFRVTMPLDPQKMRDLHTRYHSMDAIDQQLLRPALERSAYMSGPLMSSKESAAERRSDLFHFIEDQLKYGVCKVLAREEKVVDPLSGKDRTIKVVEPIMDKKTGGCARQEPSPLETYGIGVDSFNINSIAYDKDVEEQIKGQQKLAMDVQTAIAESKKAEQRALTVAKQAEADAAKAKGEQEVIRAREVTKAEQEKAVAITQAEKVKAVAQLSMEAAELTKKEQILLGEGEASRKRAVMQANGYIEDRLASWEKVNLAYAEQLGKQPQVPSIVMGGGAGTDHNMMGMFGLMQLQTMRQLGLKMDAFGKMP